MRDSKSNQYVRVDTIAGKKIIKVKDLLGGAGNQIFLPDVGWTEYDFSNYLPVTYRTKKQIQKYFEADVLQNEIITHFLSDGISPYYAVEDMLREYILDYSLYGDDAGEPLGDEQIKLFKAVWLYRSIVMDESRSLEWKCEHIANELIRTRRQWVNNPNVSEYQKQLPQIMLRHQHNLYELVNVCAKLSFEQLLEVM